MASCKYNCLLWLACTIAVVAATSARPVQLQGTNLSPDIPSASLRVLLADVTDYRLLSSRLRKEFAELISQVDDKAISLIGDKQRTLVKTSNLRLDKQNNGMTTPDSTGARFYQVAIQDNVRNSNVYASVLITPSRPPSPEALRNALLRSADTVSIVRL